MTGDPKDENAKPDELSAKRALADEAQELLNDKGVFMGAVKAVRIKWYREWLDATDEAVIAQLRAKLQALDAVPQLIQTAVNDYTVAARHKKYG